MNEPRLYGDLASWWPILSAPADYAEEAGIYRAALLAHGQGEIRTMLELGSGGGNNASHLKAGIQLTLVDSSPGMLAVSRALNPELEHLEGDMRSVRLDRLFDAVFIHDAISYMRTEADLRAAIRTAFVHCRPGGVSLFAPGHVRESFRPSTTHGGRDCGSRGMRYLEWTWDPDPLDDTYLCDFAYLLRDEDETVRVEYDRHVLGLFERQLWLRVIADAGFEPKVVPFEHSEVPPGLCELFLGVRPVEAP
jgi:SAM-dependent methyltransferase